MWSPFRIFRPNREADDAQMRAIHDIMTSIREVLSSPIPDTFVGRKTYEPFPQDEEQPQIEGWLNSQELQPPK